MSSTILSINTNKPKTRVEFSQPLQSISEIQLVDYDFPETYEKFETDQFIRIADLSKTYLTISANNYDYKTIRTMAIMTKLDINFYSTNDGYSISCKNDIVAVSKELAKVLCIPKYLIPGKYYPITWPTHKFHVYCDVGTSSSVLGQITTKDYKLVHTNLLAVVPSKSGNYPSCQIGVESGPINYITLLVLDENGENPNWVGESFRINLRVTY